MPDAIRILFDLMNCSLGIESNNFRSNSGLNRCILCELCVRASRDADGKRVFAISGRGLDSHLVVDSPSGRLGDSTFAATDRAAHVCPVGAILSKHKGYDVPIGERLYDREPISKVGDVAANEMED